MVKQNDFGEHMFFVAHGILEVRRKEDGERRLRKLVQGDHFGSVLNFKDAKINS